MIVFQRNKQIMVGIVSLNLTLDDTQEKWDGGSCQTMHFKVGISNIRPLCKIMKWGGKYLRFGSLRNWTRL